MWPDHKLHLSPFVECAKTSWRLGYRDVSSGMIVASVELPVELIERTTLSNISIEVNLSGTGEISSAASGVTSNLCSANRTISLDELVDRLLDRKNIHMEETTQSELKILLEKLQKSIQAVQRAIAGMNSVST